MEDERRMSTRTRKVAPRMAAALASADNRTQVSLLVIFSIWGLSELVKFVFFFLIITASM